MTNSIGYFIYDTEDTRIAKSNLIKLLHVSHIIAHPISEERSDLELELREQKGKIDQLVIYSREDLPPFGEKFLKLFELLAESKMKLYFLIENLTFDTSTPEFMNILKLLKSLKTLPKFSFAPSSKQERDSRVKQYLEETNLPMKEIARRTGLSLSHVYLKRKILKQKSRPVLHLKQG